LTDSENKPKQDPAALPETGSAHSPLPRERQQSADQAAAGKGLFQRINDGLYEYYVAPYRRTFARAQRDEEDLFMLLVFAESLGVPNPAAYYTMELLPVVYDRFHEWHKRMGMERSPLDHVHCC
jgi:hypothetical protein